MRNRFADVLYDLGLADDRLCVVVADISPAGPMAKFRTQFPDRFLDTGVAEQIMIGMCAGMAMRGLRPFAYTIAKFALYRPFEFVRDDLCYQNLPVTIVGIGGGLTYSTLGGTHHAQEDVAIATAIPNLSVIAPCDPAEAEAATRWCATKAQGPVYLRLGKTGEPELTGDAVDHWVFGKLRHVTRGSDVCILTYGPIARVATEIAARYRSAGKSVSLAIVHTLKPLDQEGIVESLRGHDHVIVVEEASPHGGLGAQTKQLAWEAQASCKLDTFSLQDKFIHHYGSHDELLAAHGLECDQIMARLNSDA
jgi:transketolase